jgi:hypothetical protein
MCRREREQASTRFFEKKRGKKLLLWGRLNLRAD